MSPDWTAFAYATEPSERTLAATAALIGAATFALISDIAARSGSSSPASSLSSSCVSCRYSWGFFILSLLPVWFDCVFFGGCCGFGFAAESTPRVPRLLARELRELLAGQLLVVG